MSHILLGIALDRKKLFTFNQVFIQSIWENQVLQFFPWALKAKYSKTFSVGTRRKIFLTSATTVDTQQMSKTQSN